MEPAELPQLKLISSLTPAAQSRAWQTAVHPHLPIVATASSEKTVNVYSLTSFNLLSTISGGHKRSVRTCAWKPGTKGESILATGSFDASVGVWQHNDEEKASREEFDFTGSGWNGDDNKDEEEEWRFALVLDGHDSEVKSVSWSAGGNLLATCSRDKSVWIWEEVGVDDYETIAVLQEHTADVKTVAWHPEEELLASGSYDDDVRLWREDVDDWGCVSVLRGHESTVWMVEWEGTRLPEPKSDRPGTTGPQQEWLARRETAGARLVSCSDDITIRIWRRVSRDNKAQNTMSIIRSGSNEEEWTEEAKLPQAHLRPIYAVAWSKTTGRIVSAGGDGKIVVYEERWRDSPTSQTNEAHGEGGDVTMADSGVAEEDEPATTLSETVWVIVAEVEASHDVFEVNHVAWAKRADTGKSQDDEEVIISTGDDGEVNVWSLPA